MFYQYLLLVNHELLNLRVLLEELIQLFICIWVFDWLAGEIVRALLRLFGKV